ncbi:hypothetical protein BX616_004952 [Lobosporangium transversale]|nr:hypothetical protein BX616_004952 [Lobosporangium transversale]
MKVSTQILATSAIAFTATALAMPSMSKRVIDGTKVLGCLASTFMKGDEAWSPECAAAAATDIGLAQEVSLGEFDIDFASSDPMSMPISLPNLQVRLASLPGTSWPIVSLANHDNGVAIAEFDFPMAPAEVKDSIVKNPIERNVVNILPGLEDAFSNYLANIITKPSYTFSIGGNVDASLKVPSLSGNSKSSDADSSKTLTATNIGISAPVTVRGLDNLQKIEYVELVSLTKDADSGVTTVAQKLNIHNPSELSMNIGDIALNILNANGDLMGVINIPSLYLAIGDNAVTATATFTDPDTYNTLTTKSNTFTLAGFDGSVKNPILAKALCSFVSHIAFPKLEAE